MTTEVDNKQNPVAASEETATKEDAPVAKETTKETVKPAGDGAGGDATEPAKVEEAKTGEADKADAAATTEAKPEPPVKYNVHRQNFEKDVVYLYQFSRTPVLPSLSPYCLKVETWLRLAGLKYEVN